MRLLNGSGADAPSLHEQRYQHDEEKDRRHERRAARVPHDRLLDDAERDRGGEHERQSLHPADDAGGEGADEDRGAEDGAQRQADHARSQEHREEREDARYRPHRRAYTADGDSEQEGAVCVVGARADGNANGGETQEPGDCEDADEHGGRGGKY